MFTCLTWFRSESSSTSIFRVCEKWMLSEESAHSLRCLLMRYVPKSRALSHIIWATAWDFQQFNILTSVNSDEPVQPPFKLRSSKACLVSSLTLIEYSRDEHRLWSDCAHAQADLSLCRSHIPHCWKSHALAQFFVATKYIFEYAHDKFRGDDAKKHTNIYSIDQRIPVIYTRVCLYTV